MPEFPHIVFVLETTEPDTRAEDIDLFLKEWQDAWNGLPPGPVVVTPYGTELKAFVAGVELIPEE